MPLTERRAIARARLSTRLEFLRRAIDRTPELLIIARPMFFKVVLKLKESSVSFQPDVVFFAN